MSRPESEEKIDELNNEALSSSQARYVDLTSPTRPMPYVYVKIPFSVYTKVLKHLEFMKHRDPEKNIVKGAWTKEEDDKLLELVHLMGAKGWNQIAQQLPGRLGKQCRERYINHLDPTVCKDKWSYEEDQAIMEAFRHYGAQWSKISRLLPRTRTANGVKNHWNSSLKRTYQEMFGEEAEKPKITGRSTHISHAFPTQSFMPFNPAGFYGFPNPGFQMPQMASNFPVLPPLPPWLLFSMPQFAENTSLQSVVPNIPSFQPGPPQDVSSTLDFSQAKSAEGEITSTESGI
jgi:hypothetical protein